MTSSKKPAKPKPAKKRGRPEEPLIIRPEDARGVLDSLLGKRQCPEPTTGGPTVRSRKKPTGA